MERNNWGIGTGCSRSQEGRGTCQSSGAYQLWSVSAEEQRCRRPWGMVVTSSTLRTLPPHFRSPCTGSRDHLLHCFPSLSSSQLVPLGCHWHLQSAPSSFPPLMKGTSFPGEEQQGGISRLLPASLGCGFGCFSPHIFPRL